MPNEPGIEKDHQGQDHPAVNAGANTPPSQVEGVGSSPEAGNGSNGSGPNAENARRRVEARLQERMAAMEVNLERIAQAVSQPRQSQPPSASGQASTIWEAPEAYLGQREERLLGTVEQRIEAATQRAVVAMETRMARELIKSKAGNNPDTQAEIEDIARANGYHLIAQGGEPMKAAENAIRDWETFRAVSASQNRQPIQNAPSRAQAPAINGGASNGTPKAWTGQMIRQAMDDGSYFSDDAKRAAIQASLRSQGLIK